jgi:hypothetical protein
VHGLERISLNPLAYCGAKNTCWEDAHPTIVGGRTKSLSSLAKMDIAAVQQARA